MNFFPVRCKTKVTNYSRCFLPLFENMSVGLTPQRADVSYRNAKIQHHLAVGQLVAGTVDANDLVANTATIDTLNVNNLNQGSATFNDLTANLIDALDYYKLQGAEVLSSTDANSIQVGFGTAPSVTSTGTSNTSVGTGVLGGLTTGSSNTGVGSGALVAVTTGSSNSAIGSGALAAVTTGSGNSALGHSANVSSGTVSNSIILGNGATSSASGQLVLHGVVNGLAVLVGGTVTVTTTAVTSTTIILLSRKVSGGTLGNLTWTVTSGTSFTITSSSGTDTSTVAYLAFEI